MPKYTKRKDGLYSAYITTGYNDAGKPKRKYVYARTIPEIEGKLSSLRIKYQKGMTSEDENLTIQQWAKMWESERKNVISYNTMRCYKNALDSHIIPKLGHMKLKDIKTIHVQQLIQHMISEGLSSSSISKVKITLSQLFNQAIQFGIAYFNPAQSIKIPSSRNRKEVLDEYTISLIKEAAALHPDGPLMLTLLYTGMRRGEALALTWDDIDLKTRQITVNKAIYFSHNQPVAKETKTEAGVRIVPILKPLHDVLTQYKLTSHSIVVFPHPDGGYMTDTVIKKHTISFIKACNQINKEKHREDLERGDAIPEIKFTLHQFRHTFASMLYKAGVGLKEAQEILGHSSINVTMDIYTHLADKERKNAADQLDKFLTTE